VTGRWTAYYGPTSRVLPGHAGTCFTIPRDRPTAQLSARPRDMADEADRHAFSLRFS